MNDGQAYPYRTRLWVIFASDAPKAVILRRGPKNHYHLIDWDLRTDSFVHGQWMRGFVRLWDLSPRGRRLLYWAHQYHPGAHWRRETARPSASSDGRDTYDPGTVTSKNRSPRKGEHRRKMPRYMRERIESGPKSRPPVRPNEGVWTAVSTPPYFSALAIWPGFGHWTGGGTFQSESTIVLNEAVDCITPQENVPVPSTVKIVSNHQLTSPKDWPVFAGWHPWMCEQDDYDRIAMAAAAAGKRWLDWVAPRETGDVLFAADGCIYRLANRQRAKSADLLDSADCIADFRNLRFTQMRAPADAMRW